MIICCMTKRSDRGKQSGRPLAFLIWAGTSSAENVHEAQTFEADLGSCMMAVLNTAGQVSVYAPRGDPIRTQWVEVGCLSTCPVLRMLIHLARWQT